MWGRDRWTRIFSSLVWLGPAARAALDFRGAMGSCFGVAALPYGRRLDWEGDPRTRSFLLAPPPGWYLQQQQLRVPPHCPARQAPS